MRGSVAVVRMIDAIHDRRLRKIEWAYPIQANHVLSVLSEPQALRDIRENKLFLVEMFANFAAGHGVGK